jgi:O-antigen ligase
MRINKKTIDSVGRFVILGLALAISFDVFHGFSVIIVALSGLAILLVKTGPSKLLAALSVGGLFFITFIKEMLIISASYIVILQIIIIAIIVIKNSKYFGSIYNRKALRSYRIWLVALYLTVFIQYLLGPVSTWSTFLFEYFLVYASYYILAGMLVARLGIGIQDILLPCVFLSSFIYPLIGTSVSQVPNNAAIVDIGLRLTKNFSAIGHDRIAGQMIVLAIFSFVTSQDKRKVAPEAVVAIFLSLPILWFSYTRQSIIAVYAAIIFLLYEIIFKRKFIRPYLSKALILFLIGISLFITFAWIEAEYSRHSNSRLSVSGIVGMDESSLTRLDLWRFSWEHIKMNPILGYGLGGFASLYEASGAGAWPHNWIIEAWFEYGLIGLIIFLLGMYLLIHRLVSSSNPWLINWGALGIFWLVVIQVSGNIPENAPIFFFISVMALTRSPNRIVIEKNFH